MINKLKVKSKKFKSQAAFTVLESIVAIAVLSLSISGAFAAISQSLSQSIIAKQEVKAFYLAQEAVEIIRNKRDINQLKRINGSSVSWLDGIAAANNASNPCYFGKTCTVDVNGLTLTDCVTACPNLRQDPSTFLYGYNGGWDDSGFRREIQITSISPNEVSVAVSIYWSKGIINRQFTAKTSLFNWAGYAN